MMLEKDKFKGGGEVESGRRKSKGDPLLCRKTPSIKCWTADEVNLETMNPGWGTEILN